MGDPKRGLPPSVTGDKAFPATGQEALENGKDNDHKVVEEIRRKAEEYANKERDKILNSEEAKKAESIIGKSRFEKMVANFIESQMLNVFINNLRESPSFFIQRDSYVGGEGSPFIFETLVEAKAKVAAADAWNQEWSSGAGIGRDCKMAHNAHELQTIGIRTADELEAETWEKNWVKKMGEAYQLMIEALG